jgi:hypothetical protein
LHNQTHEEFAGQLRMLTTGLRAVLDVLATHIEGRVAIAPVTPMA